MILKLIYVVGVVLSLKHIYIVVNIRFKEKFQKYAEGTSHTFILRVSESPLWFIPRAVPIVRLTFQLAPNNLFRSINPISGNTHIIYGVMTSPFSPNQIS